MSDTVAQTPYEILGDQGVKALARAFYDAMDTLPEFAELRAMHAPDLGPMSSKLASYLVGWMGGPPVYQAITGTVCLTDPHAPFHIGPRQRDQWLACMDEALNRVDAPEELRQMLKMPLFQVAETVRNSDDSDPPPRDPNLIAIGR